jgi:hypothetical protein
MSLAGGGASDRLDQLILRGFLEHVRDRSGAQRVARVRRLVLHGEHDDLGRRPLG